MINTNLAPIYFLIKNRLHSIETAITPNHIFNSIGEVVQEIDLKASNNMQINLEENCPGIYYLKFEKKAFISQKIIIVN